MIKRILFFMVFALIVSCEAQKKIDSDDLKFIQENGWIHDSGAKLGTGDVLSFNNVTKYHISSDTIYNDKIAIGKILEVHKDDNELLVVSIPSNENGVYVNMREFTK